LMNRMKVYSFTKLLVIDRVFHVKTMLCL